MHQKFPIRSLAEVPGLEGLLDVCDSLKIDLIAHGPLVRRLASHFTAGNDTPPYIDQLLDCLPTVNLAYGGDLNLDAEIHQAIHELVPFAEFYGWRVRHMPYMENLHSYNLEDSPCPVERMALHTRTNAGIVGDPEAFEELESSRFHFEMSRFREEKGSAERLGNALLHFLHYLKVLCEELSEEKDKDPVGLLEQQPGLENFSHYLQFDVDFDPKWIFQKSTWRTRLRSRYLELLATASDEAFWRLMWERAFGEVPMEVRSFLPDFGEGGFTRDFVVREKGLIIGGQSDRFASFQGDFRHGFELGDGTALASSQVRSLDSEKDKLPSLADSQRRIASSPPAEFQRGASARHRIRASEGEFACFQFPIASDHGSFGELGSITQLTFQLAPESGDGDIETRGCLLSLPSNVQILNLQLADSHREGEQNRPSKIAQVSVNFGRLLSELPGFVENELAAKIVNCTAQVHLVCSDQSKSEPEFFWGETEDSEEDA